MEYYATRKRNKLLIDATTWINLSLTMLSERNKAEKSLNCMILFL